MMFNIKNSIYGKQHGFTLIETLVAFLIVSILTVGLAGITIKMFTVPESSSARLTAIIQANNAVYAISQDAMQANTISVNTSGDFLYLTWTNYGTQTTNTVAYTINSTNNTLLRSLNGGTATIVATNVDPSTSCSYSSNTLTLNITATVTGRTPATETRQVQVVRRPT
jgi:prepilin-type N-terminal cleavage/methylation domain-containing protein